MTQIIRCRVENILGAKLIEFAPKGKSVTIGGKNGQGKSSAIRALCMALGGKEQVPAEPVTKGAEVGEINIELEEFTVHLEVHKNRQTELVIESKSGARYPRPQSMLDKLFGGLSFNPGAFKLMDKAKRLETLRGLVKLDFTELDERYAKGYEMRRDIGRKVKELEGKLVGRQVHQDVPSDEISVSDVLEQLSALQALNRQLEAKKQEAAELEREQAALARTNCELLDQIRDLESGIALRREKIELNEKRRVELTTTASTLRSMVESALVAEDTATKAMEFDKQIRDSESINRKVRENADLLSLKTELETAIKQQATYDKGLQKITDTKRTMLEEAKFPVEGLSFNGDGVTYKGVPFEQLSESEQWEISTAIGFSLNPKGILFMANSGGLDKDARDRIRARAAELGVQLFLEVVDDAEDVQVLVQEGVVKEDRCADAV